MIIDTHLHPTNVVDEAWRHTGEPLTGERMLEMMDGPYWINGKRGRGIVSLRMGPQAYWAATTHPKERPRRDRAIREAGGDVWAGIDRLLGNEHPQRQQVA